MNQELTLEQALNNLKIVCDKFFIGKKEEHMALDKSIALIEESLKSVSKSSVPNKSKDK